MAAKKYGKTREDAWALDLSKSRQIVSEIMTFGVSQNQINQIINLLSLELENRDHMNAYRAISKQIEEGSPVSEAMSINTESKIILDS